MGIKSTKRSINLILDNGTLDGVVRVTEDSDWNDGWALFAPRGACETLPAVPECSSWGVYLLLSDDKVYVGQASDLIARVKQHLKGKSWWERVVLFTTKDNKFTKSDIDYLEYDLIAKASANGHLHCDNKQKGNKPKVSEHQETVLVNYLEGLFLHLGLRGIHIFDAGGNPPPPPPKKNSTKSPLKSAKTKKPNSSSSVLLSRTEAIAQTLPRLEKADGRKLVQKKFGYSNGVRDFIFFTAKAKPDSENGRTEYHYTYTPDKLIGPRAFAVFTSKQDDFLLCIPREEMARLEKLANVKTDSDTGQREFEVYAARYDDGHMTQWVGYSQEFDVTIHAIP